MAGVFEPRGALVALLLTVFCIPAYLRHRPKSRVLLAHAHLLYIIRDGEKGVPPPRTYFSFSRYSYTYLNTYYFSWALSQLLVQFG